MSIRELLPAALLNRYRPGQGTRPGAWYTIRNQRSDRAVVELYDVIGEYGIPAREFVRELRDIDAGVIELRINSPGGMVYDGLAIYNALRDHPARVEATVDGLAASAASWILQAAEHRTMNRHSELMIHDGLGMTIGNQADHRTMADDLGRISDNIASIYAGRAGGGPAEWRAAMLAETWFTAAEALDAGLADDAVTDDAELSNTLPRTQLVTARARAHLRSA